MRQGSSIISLFILEKRNFLKTSFSLGEILKPLLYIASPMPVDSRSTKVAIIQNVVGIRALRVTNDSNVSFPQYGTYIGITYEITFSHLRF